MHVNGDRLLAEMTARMGIHLPALVAACTLWAHPDVVEAVRYLHPSGAWFPKWRRSKADEVRRTMVNGINLDDNSMANLAIKKAIFGDNRTCQRFHTCHVWPKTCYDPRYHTSIANLVLVPAALVALTDHNSEVAACLQYRSFDLYHWYPQEVAPPIKPLNYPSAAVWFPPVSVTPKVRKVLANLESAFIRHQ